MRSIPKAEAAPSPPLPELARTILREEIAEIVHLSVTLAQSLGFLQSRLKTEFPKRCSKCRRIFASFEEFFYSTEGIDRGTVSYPILGKDFFLHRNCLTPCDTTLIVVFEDRRDESIPGARRRQVFESCLARLRREFHLDEAAARSVLLAVLATELPIPVGTPIAD